MKLHYILIRFSFPLLLLTILPIFGLFAQSGVGINPSGASPHPSAILDASSTNQGILIPRLTEEERNAIENPAFGLQIFNMNTGCLNIYFGSTWKQLCPECSFQHPALSNNSPVCEGDNLSITATLLPGATYSWTGPNGFSSSLQNPTISEATVSAGGTYSLTVTLDGCASTPITTLVTVNPVPLAPTASSDSPVCENGTLNLSASAITGASYSWTGPDGYISTEQNPSIANVSPGAEGNYHVTATVAGCTGSAGTTNVSITDLIGAPTAASHSASGTQIVWNWNPVSGASGYKWNTVNDFNTATDHFTSTTHTQSGLNYNTAYNFYVWSYNICGHSSVTNLSQSTTPFQCGTESVTYTYKGASVTYGTVTGQNGTCWLDRNLGASQVATSVLDPNGRGDLFQWGRADDLHQERTSSTQAGPTTNPNPGNVFITGGGNWYSGSSPAYDTFWQGVNGLHNPCPSGFRIPTRTEWDNERLSWSQNNRTGAFNSSLKLCTTGRRTPSGVVENETYEGLYWYSTVYYGGESDLTSLKFHDSGAYINYEARSYGAAVRCIRN